MMRRCLVRNVLTVIVATKKSHGQSLNVRLTADEASRLALGGFSPALAAAWSFSRGIPTTYRAFATGAAATHLWRRTHRSRRLFEEHPALRRRCRPRRGDLGLGHSGQRCGGGLYDQGA